MNATANRVVVVVSVCVAALIIVLSSPLSKLKYPERYITILDTKNPLLLYWMGTKKRNSGSTLNLLIGLSCVKTMKSPFAKP